MIRKLIKSSFTRTSFNRTSPLVAYFSTGKIPIEYTQLFLNNEFVNAQDGQTFETVNPATEEVIANVQRAGQKDVDIAVANAQKAFEGEWRHMSATQRGRCLYKFADLIEQNIDEISRLESLDSGKPISFSRNVDLVLAVKCYRYYAGLADKITGQVLPIEGDHFCYTRQEPVGVSAQIIPWNFPLLMMAWKWGPCLAAGSVSILKTSEKTPLSALKVASLAKEAGFPPGVVQVLSGYGDVGNSLVEHPGVDKIAFTGSTKVGKMIAAKCAEQNLKRVTLELGGKSPNIICHDADVDLAVASAKVGLFLNQGQCCIAGSRIYVHEQIYDEFVQKMVESTKQINLGNPQDAETSQGPQVDKIQFDQVMRYIGIGKQEGAKCVLGGQAHGDKGYFVQPTIFTDVEDNMTISREEIFGPVMQISKFNDYDDVIKRANDTQYGLGAGVVTQDVGLYQKLANSIRAGTVYVNCYDVFDAGAPFGGFKNSGLGRELGPKSVQNYLENKTVIVKRQPGTIP